MRSSLMTTTGPRSTSASPALTDTLVSSVSSTSTSTPFSNSFGSRTRTYPDVNALLGTTARLSCNVTPPAEGPVNLILWYKSGNGTGPPIYTVDARNSSSSSNQAISSMTKHQQHSVGNNNNNNPLLRATHSINSEWKDRASFNLSVHPSILSINGLREEDSSEYSCRVSASSWHHLFTGSLISHSCLVSRMTFLVNTRTP